MSRGSENNTGCPVCQKFLCGHILPEVARKTYEDHLSASAQTPLDRGVSRFATEVAWLMGGTQ